jgi:hypothetical protein
MFSETFCTITCHIFPTNLPPSNVPAYHVLTKNDLDLGSQKTKTDASFIKSLFVCFNTYPQTNIFGPIQNNVHIIFFKCSKHVNEYELSIKFFWKLPESVSGWYKTGTKTVSAISQPYHDDTGFMLATVLYVYIITRRVVWMESGF